MYKLYEDANTILRLFQMAKVYYKQKNTYIQDGRSLNCRTSASGRDDRGLGQAPSVEMTNTLGKTMKTDLINTKKIIQLVISDFLEQEMFTLKGLADEVNVPLDSLSNIYVKQHYEPSCSLAVKLLQLHAQMFPALYSGAV